MRAPVLSPEAQREACREIVRTRAAAAMVRGLSLAKRAHRLRVYRAAVARVVEHNQGLVFAQAHRVRCAHLDVEDLAQAGNLGLLHAIEKFDPERGVAFTTYAIWSIRQAITRSIQNADATVRIPVHVFEARKRIVRHAARFEAREGRRPSDEELAALAGMPAKKIASLRAVNISPAATLDAPLSSEDDAGDTRLDRIPSSGPTPEDEVLRTEREAFAIGLLTKLPERELAVIAERYWNDRTLLEVGAEALGAPVSRERARQLESSALQRLRARCARVSP